MVELHGWAMLRENYAADDEESHIEQIVASLIQKIDVQINYSNGEALVTAAKFTNHLTMLFRYLYWQREILRCGKTRSFHRILRR